MPHQTPLRQPVDWSRTFVPTLREEPAGVESPTRRLLVRAGYCRTQAGGGFANLTLAARSLAKIERIVRVELAALGAHEVRLPVSEALEIARAEMRSARQMPQLWVSALSGAAALSGPVPGIGAISFDAEAAGLEISYRNLRVAFRKALSRCGVHVVEVEGGFLAPCEGGEDRLARCPQCGYTANLNRAAAQAPEPVVADPDGDMPPEPFHTPSRKTIAEVAEFTGLPGSSQMKSLVLVADGTPVLVMVRGDDQMSGPRFLAAMGACSYRPATPPEIADWFGAEPGSLGPVGARIRTIADLALKGRRNMVSGANRTDYHLRNVTPGRDFQPEYFNLRRAAVGDICGQCGGAALTAEPAIEVALLRKLGGAVPPLACLGEIRVERILETLVAAGVAAGRDENGMCLPVGVAPFDVVVTPVNMKDDAVREAGVELASELAALGLDVLHDDRDERPGVKFKDADLVGIPWRITIGGKKLALGLVELFNRKTREVRDLSPEAALDAVVSAWGASR